MISHSPNIVSVFEYIVGMVFLVRICKFCVLNLLSELEGKNMWVENGLSGLVE